ncbi:F-box protein CPR1-like isoform X2 [Coffea arabica]|uniref:F-box protein CPR1-like isoform X2 n=1 Tax=Coffea arabica TaxID=13443 RepID=A0A6P6UEZ6_COFAR|nr:F-box protein CPR1-like isoform X2 [Coffea arabica]
MPNLPQELITDILTRLPVKSLLRFRCVSKPWCSVIDSRSFIKMHLLQSKKTGSNLFLMLGFLGIYSVELDSLDAANRLRPPYSASDVSNSCNGLILVLAKIPFIWNPFTRKYRELPATPVEQPVDFEVGSAYVTYGFAYDAVNDDYRVVRVEEFRGFDSEWIRSEAKLYSSKSDKWRKIKNFPYQLPYKRAWGAHLNGVLHTGVRTGDLGYFDSSIWAFDVRTEQHYTLPKPDFTGTDLEFTVEVLGGCLCLVRPRKRYRTDVWIMKEYGVKESWTKLLTIAPPLVERYITIGPLAYSRNGEEVLLNHDDKQLIWYDLRRKTVRNVSVDGLPFVFYAEVCVASLIQPDVSGEGDETEELRQQEKSRVKKRLRKCGSMTS